MCVTRDEFLRMKEGQSAAAGASGSGGIPEATGGSSANEIPDADEGTVPHNDDGAAAVAASTLDACSSTTDNQPAAPALRALL